MNLLLNYLISPYDHKMTIRIKALLLIVIISVLGILLLPFLVSNVKISYVQVSPGSQLGVSNRLLVVAVVSTDAFFVERESVSKEELGAIISDTFFKESYSGVLLIFDESLNSNDQAKIKEWTMLQAGDENFKILSSIKT